jgi:hypothetical protein
MKNYNIKFSESELMHLLTLIQTNHDEGWYYGPCDQYWKRSDRIEEKIRRATTCDNNDPEAMCPGCNCWKQTRKECS